MLYYVVFFTEWPLLYCTLSAFLWLDEPYWKRQKSIKVSRTQNLGGKNVFLQHHLVVPDFSTEDIPPSLWAGKVFLQAWEPHPAFSSFFSSHRGTVRSLAKMIVPYCSWPGSSSRSWEGIEGTKENWIWLSNMQLDIHDKISSLGTGEKTYFS